MELVESKLSNGNVIKYKRLNSETCYHESTIEKVWSILEHARIRRFRIRVFYGDVKTGKCWNEEYDIIGYIGRSTGNIKIPLMINNSRSIGGPALLDDCIIKIIDMNKKTLYQHENFHTGEFTIGKSQYDDLPAAVFCDGINTANFKTKEKAKRYIAFMKGERLTK